ncbi:TPA: hypothetical protein DIC21_00530, partial [Candidatus Uhrbacteria bacterium]|nr:hypothetical protein [Candidatus Uhrbacteria bacterium]
MKKEKTPNFFSLEQMKILLELVCVVLRNEDINSTRSANAYSEMLRIFFDVLKTTSLDQERKKIKKAFEDLVFTDFSEILSDFSLACLNTAQYKNFLDLLNEAVTLGVTKEEDWLQECAESFVGLGRTKEAEELVADYSLTRPSEFWPYIILGDIFYFYQIQNTKQDFKKAEEWYYYAYDRGISKDNEDDWHVLLERLGSVCIDRLRRSAYDRLLKMFQDNKIGDWRLLSQWKEVVYCAGAENPLHQQIIQAIGLSSEGIADANERLKVLQDAYNLSPQKRLDDFSPFEMEINCPKGELELRFREEMFNGFLEQHKVDAQSKKEVDSRFFQDFSDFQVTFMNQKDPIIGKKRIVLVNKERKKTKKLFDDGRLIWTGFEVFRNR